MTNVPINIRLNLSGLVGWLPGSGFMLGAAIAKKIAEGVAHGVLAEFKLEKIPLVGGVTVFIEETLARKEGSKTILEIALTLCYEVADYETVALEKSTGFMRLGLIFARGFIENLPQMVEHQIQSELFEKLHSRLPQQVRETLLGYGIIAEGVNLLRDKHL